MIKKKEMEYIIIIMEINMMGNFLIMKKMEKEYIIFMMEINI